MAHAETSDGWSRFLEYAKKRCSSATSFENWLAPIRLIESTPEEITLEVPNVFVKEYLLSNYSNDLCSFVPVKSSGHPAINFTIIPPKIEKVKKEKAPANLEEKPKQETSWQYLARLNPTYTFESFIEGPSNQFVKSAAIGVASRPGKSYNPLFIHGGVGLGKTHLLHSIGHYINDNLAKQRVQCITTEAFINNLVESLRNKSIDQWKQFYRRDVDVLLVDDIQFLQNRPNFEEEFCNTFESLINQHKQIVITSDKPPAQLKLSERMIARMEWGLVANVGIPELETRVAIIQAKAEQKGLKISNRVAFHIAEYIFSNIRQLEGAINRLSAQSRLLNMEISEELVEKTLSEMLRYTPQKNISVDDILKCVATVFQVKVSDIKSATRTKNIAFPRQVAMYLAKELIGKESLAMLGAYFGRTHSTLLHAHKLISKERSSNEQLEQQLSMILKNLDTPARI